MLRNIEFTVLEPNQTEKAEKFNGEFSSLSYYYFLKLRKVKISSCSHIKIRIYNEAKTVSTSYTPAGGFFWIVGSYDFTHYLQLSTKEKLKFQYEMIYEILKNAFIEYGVDYEILDNVNNELAENNWEMRYEWTRKKINKKCFFKLILYMEIDALTFLGEITHGDKKEELLIFKSLPGFFVMYYLFQKFNLLNNKIRIGSIEKPIFEIDITNKTVAIVDKGNKGIEMFEYGTSTNLKARYSEAT